MASSVAQQKYGWHVGPWSLSFDQSVIYTPGFKAFSRQRIAKPFKRTIDTKTSNQLTIEFTQLLLWN